MHLAKKGLRILGIAESFASRDLSVLAGVVMRKDLRIDGAAFHEITVGGMDATEGVIALYRNMDRRDINLIMISGSVIAWYNILDPVRVSKETGKPVVSVTYEESEGLEEEISRHFPGDAERLERYRRLGERKAFLLPNGHTIFLRCHGIPIQDAGRLCRDLILDGKIPEPLRVARLAARGTMQFLSASK